MSLLFLSLSPGLKYFATCAFISFVQPQHLVATYSIHGTCAECACQLTTPISLLTDLNDML